MSAPSDRRYAKSHEWLKLTEDGTALVGISDYAQSSLGDITYVQLPKPGEKFRPGEVFGVVESVKAASDLYVPVSGEVLEVNGALDANPEKVNQSPYEEGWMIRLKLSEPGEAGGLLSAEAYGETTAGG
jgi:glycine cleavage system H protein